MPNRQSGGVVLVLLLILSLALNAFLIAGKLGLLPEKLGGEKAKALIPAMRPALPVEVGFRKSLVGQGMVAEFTNRADKPLALTVTINSASGEKKDGKTIELKTGEKAEVGWVQGWKFVKGDRITVKNPDYRDLEGTVP
jgi:hypothetical protein